MTEISRPESSAGSHIKELAVADSSLSLNLMGGRLESLKLGGLQLVFSGTRIDGGTGSTHLCSPNSGSAKKGPVEDGYDLDDHGPGRKDEWEELESGPDFIKIGYVIKGGKYPSGMHVTQEYRFIDRGVKITTRHENKNKDHQLLPKNEATHMYWITEFGATREGRGWENADGENVKVNGQDVAQMIRDDTGMFWRDENDIEMPGRPTLRVKQTGLPYVQGWAAKDESTGQYDSKYACLEPAEGPEERFGTPKSMIAPGESRETELFIQVLASESQSA